MTRAVGGSGRGLRRAVATAVLVIGLVGALAGCAGPGAAEGQRVADWIADQQHVTGASAAVSEDPWNQGVDIAVQVAPDISDADLTDLTAAAEQRAREAGWEHPFIGYDLGDDRSFSNLGGAPTLGVFLAIRGDADYLVASARGTGDCDGMFCVTLDDDDPRELLAEVHRLLDLADANGGVQTNLTFTASNRDGSLRVSAEPLAPIDDAVQVWRALSTRLPIDRARAWSIEPVGDLPPSQLLDLTVPDEAAKALAETIAATQTLVEVRVDVAATAP